MKGKGTTTALHHDWSVGSIRALDLLWAAWDRACLNLPKGKGPALLPGPPAPSEGSAGVRQLVLPEGPTAPRSWRTSSGFRFLRPRARSEDQSAAFVYGPSWGIHSSRPALPAAFARNALVPHRARDKYLFRRLFPAGPEDRPKEIDIAGRRRSVLLSLPPHRASPERVSWLWRLGRPPRSPLEGDSFCRVAKAKSHASGLWITWISRISRSAGAAPATGRRIPAAPGALMLHPLL